MQNDSFKCVSIMRRIIEVKDPTEELTGIYFITLVVGYFADAQYDVRNMGYFACARYDASNIIFSFYRLRRFRRRRYFYLPP